MLLILLFQEMDFMLFPNERKKLCEGTVKKEIKFLITNLV